MPFVTTMAEVGPLDVTASLADMRLVLGLAAGRRNELVIECAANLPAVRHDALEFRRTVMALVEAAGARGTERRRIVVRATSSGRVVVLTVGEDATLYLPVWD